MQPSVSFFPGGYEDVSMDDIARSVELNKATIYLYFENKETLFATIVLRGIRILREKYQECMEKQVPGIVKVALMGQAYYRFSRGIPGLSPADPLLRVRTFFEGKPLYRRDWKGVWYLPQDPAGCDPGGHR